MKSKNLIPALLLIFISFHSFGQYLHENLKIMRLDNYSYDKVESPEKYNLSYTHNNLRLFPIIANETFTKEHKEIGNFLLLKDAIEQNKILIQETGAANNDSPNSNQQNLQLGSVGGTVNKLIAKNTSTDTIFIMAGEVVKGGKQDRVIAKDVVISPGEGVDLSAFCVEKNRWTTKEDNKGRFTGYYNVSSMDIRKAVTEEKDQSEVWDKVDEHTVKNEASSSTGAYTNLENSKEYQDKVKNYMNKFENAFVGNNKIIGFIAVTGDEIIGCDLFATNGLFMDSYKNLIHSYIGHAITKGAPIKLKNKEVFAYLDKILKNETDQEEEIEKNGTLYKWKSKKLHITTY